MKNFNVNNSILISFNYQYIQICIYDIIDKLEDNQKNTYYFIWWRNTLCTSY